MTKAMSKLTSQPTAEMMEQMQAQIGMQAMLDGINFSFFVSTFIAAVALILTLFIKRAWPAEEKPAEKTIKPLNQKQCLNALMLPE